MMNNETIFKLASELASINSTLKEKKTIDKNLMAQRKQITETLKRASELHKSYKTASFPKRLESSVPVRPKESEPLKSHKRIVLESIKEESFKVKTGLGPDKRKVTFAFDKPSNVDICFLIDATESMKPWIDSVTFQIKNLIKKASEDYKGFNYRVGYIAYRDFDLREKSFEYFDFTDKPEKMEASLAKLQAIGGGDLAEDINGGLQKVLRYMSWKGNIKILVHFADAPCHGKRFHNLEDDHDQPKSDVDWSELLSEVKEIGINYNFIELDGKKTKKMTDEFEKMWENASINSQYNLVEPLFRVFQVKEESYKDLYPKILKSIGESLKYSIDKMKGESMVFHTGPTLFEKLNEAQKLKK